MNPDRLKLFEELQELMERYEIVININNVSARVWSWH